MARQTVSTVGWIQSNQRINGASFQLELTVSRATGTQRTSSDDREDSDSDDNEAEVDGAMLIVTQLLGPFGHRDFDRISKTNAVARLLRHVQPESARSYFKELSLSLR